MNVYTTDRIRNVVLLGHGGCGKTSLVEAMAYLAGLTTRMGTVADKNTISDFDKEETKRQFSIHTSVVAIPWKDNKINVLDTPGYFDFVGEVEEAVSAADAAIIVISGKAGIETGTRRAWEICEKNHLPRMIFVTGSLRKENCTVSSAGPGGWPVCRICQCHPAESKAMDR